MNALETIVIIVGAVALLLAVVSAAGLLGRGPRERMAAKRMHHREDVPATERPSQDEVDDPIPQRRLRGRPARDAFTGPDRA